MTKKDKIEIGTLRQRDSGAPMERGIWQEIWDGTRWRFWKGNKPLKKKRKNTK
jgi:hypothetical protein